MTPDNTEYIPRGLPRPRRYARSEKATARARKRAVRAGIAALHRYSASRPVWWRWTCFLAVALSASPKQCTEAAT